MNKLGMLVDVSHIAPAGFWDVIETSSKPIIATHSNAKALCPHPRNLDDKQILAIKENDGLIGVTFAGQFLEHDYNDACIESIYRHIDYMLNSWAMMTISDSAVTSTASAIRPTTFTVCRITAQFMNIFLKIQCKHC